MATLGMTKLEAVNKMLFDLNSRGPASALDPGGNTPQAEAERQLDYVSEFIQSLGWPDNTDRSKPLTATGTGGSMTITVPATTLAIYGVAPDRFTEITLQSDLVYIIPEQTTVFPDNQLIYADVIDEKTFDTLTPTLKHLIAGIASQYYQRRKANDPSSDEWLSEEAWKFDTVAKRWSTQRDRNIRGLVLPPVRAAQPQ